MSWGLEEIGDDGRDGREQAESKESALSILPILTSFVGGSDAKAGESAGLPFDPGDEVVEEGLDACET